MHKFKMQQIFLPKHCKTLGKTSVPLLKFTLGQRILKALINDFKTSFIKQRQRAERRPRISPAGRK